MSMDVLSPELVLVDPALAAEARRRLPDPPDCLATRLREPAGGELEPPAAERVRVPRAWVTGGTGFPLARRGPSFAIGTVLRAPPSFAPPPTRFAAAVSPPPAPVEERRWPRPSLFAIVVALLLALGIGVPSFDLVPWSSAERPSLAGEGSGQAVSAAASGKIVLEWPRVENASFYDVVLWRDGRRALDLWPETNRVDVLEAVDRAGSRLASGRYQWFAFAGFGSREDVRFGKPLANGSFSVTAADAAP